MKALLLVDHGSRVARSNALLDEAATLVREALAAEGDTSTHVAIAHMELAAPSIDEAIAALVARGVDDLVVHPYFLGPGRHATEDVPRLARAALSDHPHVTLRVTAPLGPHRLLAELVLTRVRESDGT